jgi:pimeloyl-ACP methyl ester carboxylesterase
MTAFEDLYVNAPDGLRLHVLAAGPRDGARLPVVCLPGLARTAEDFRELMTALAGDAQRPRRALALDSRGRGKSARDPNPANYSVPVELGDVLAMLAALGIGRAVFVGTSRGGILTMTLSAVRPAAIAGAVLNDIGPVLDMTGLMRIKGYVGKLPKPASMDEAATILRRTLGSQFPGLDAAGWQLYARRSFSETANGIEANYDPQISAATASFDPAQPPPEMWAQFDGLAQAPLMLIRGEHSDLLSMATVKEMRRRRPDLELVEVMGQGHAPLLADRITIERICGFVARCDATNPGAAARNPPRNP